MVPCAGTTHHDGCLSHTYDNHIGSVNVNSITSGGNGLRVYFSHGSGGAGTLWSSPPLPRSRTGRWGREEPDGEWNQCGAAFRSAHSYGPGRWHAGSRSPGVDRDIYTYTTPTSESLTRSYCSHYHGRS